MHDIGVLVRKRLLFQQIFVKVFKALTDLGVANGHVPIHKVTINQVFAMRRHVVGVALDQRNLQREKRQRRGVSEAGARTVTAIKNNTRVQGSLHPSPTTTI